MHHCPLVGFGFPRNYHPVVHNPCLPECKKPFCCVVLSMLCPAEIMSHEAALRHTDVPGVTPMFFSHNGATKTRHAVPSSTIPSYFFHLRKLCDFVDFEILPRNGRLVVHAANASIEYFSLLIETMVNLRLKSSVHSVPLRSFSIASILFFFFVGCSLGCETIVIFFFFARQLGSGAKRQIAKGQQGPHETCVTFSVVNKHGTQTSISSKDGRAASIRFFVADA